MRRSTMLAGLVLLAAWIAPAGAQEPWEHPREMGLAEVDLQAPDPGALRHEMDGGLVAYVVADDLVPLVRFSALIGAGRADGAGARDYAAALRAGPADLEPSAFADTLARMTALYEVEQGRIETRVSLEVPVEDAAEALGLLAALLRAPLAGEGAVADEDSAMQDRAMEDGAVEDGAAEERPVAERSVERAGAESGPVLYEGSLAEAVELLETKLFDDHPYAGVYGSDSAGSPGSPGPPDDAAAFRRRFAVPGNVVLAVSGDLDPGAMRAQLSEAFAGWSGEKPTLPVHPMPELPARAVHTHPVDKLQGWVAIGHELPDVPVEDQAALMVMNYILGGGHFDTRLFRATRDRRGLTNDDSGFPEPGFRGPGLYTFRTYGRPQAVRLLIHLTLQEIERIRAEPVTEEELFVAHGALASGEHSLRFRDGAATATTYAREWLRHGDHTRTATWREHVRAVTADDVLAAARRYLHPERMQIVIVGPIDAIRDAPAMEGEPTLEELGETVQGS